MFTCKERTFFNSTQRHMSMKDVAEKLKEFVKKQPYGEYQLVVGTDSQVISKKTCFATVIYIRKVGTGAWACIGKQIALRNKWSLREKIGTETQITYETINILVDLIQDDILELMIAHKNFEFTVEAHIDVGTKGKTKALIAEMEGYFKGSNIVTKIKPDSYATYAANHYSKVI